MGRRGLCISERLDRGPGGCAETRTAHGVSQAVREGQSRPCSVGRSPAPVPRERCESAREGACPVSAGGRKREATGSHEEGDTGPVQRRPGQIPSHVMDSGAWTGRLECSDRCPTWCERLDSRASAYGRGPGAQTGGGRGQLCARDGEDERRCPTIRGHVPSRPGPSTVLSRPCRLGSAPRVPPAGAPGLREPHSPAEPELHFNELPQAPLPGEARRGRGCASF